MKPAWVSADVEPQLVRQRLEALQGLSLFCVYLLDLEGRLLELNDAGLALLGYSREEMSSLDITSLLDESELQKAFQQIDAIRMGGKVARRAEYRLRRKDGSPVWVKSEARAIYSQGRPYTIQGVLHDITEEKQTRRLLSESEERYRLHFESVYECIYTLDREFRVRSVSPSAERMLGYKPEELVGRAFYELNVLAPEYFEQAASDVMRVLAGEKIQAVEYEFITRDGQRKIGEVSGAPLFEDGRAVAVVSVARDITERRRMEKELHASRRRLEEVLKERTEALHKTEDRYRRLAENMRDTIWITDEVGKVVYVNESVERLMGVPASRAIGLTNHAYLTRESREKTAQWILETESAQPPRDYLHGELELLRPNGSTVPCEATITIVRDKQGKIVGYEGITRDISERKEAECALLRAKEAAVAANRSKSQFLASMSHEIRTPMNGVMGMLELLAETEFTAKQRHFAEMARSSGESLLRIINDILDFSKIEAGRLELESIPFDLEEAVEGTLVLFAEKAHSKGLEIACQLDLHVPLGLRGDPTRLRQILTNLIGNAVKFTEEGEVVVRVHCVQESPEEALLRFEVFDTGIGVSPEYRQRIFDVFSQEDQSTTRRFGGTGLGLAISRQLVEMMGGQIGLESEPGKGSTFWFTVRLKKATEGRPATKGDAGNLRDLRVLIVDDNQTNRDILHHQVLSWGMRNGSAVTGHEALELLRRAAKEGNPYDLVILDYHMPGMDGLEVARAMEQNAALRSTRRIILTSVDQNIGEQEIREAGIAAWLTKPVRSSGLYDCLATVMNRSWPKEASRQVEPPTPQEAFDAWVLLAEDNPVNQEVARSMLETLGCRVHVVGDGLEALEAVSRESFDLILMDCQMPRMDGYEATRILKKGQCPPVIALTAHAMQGDREECLAAGMDDYLSKPFAREQLLEILQRWVGR